MPVHQAVTHDSLPVPSGWLGVYGESENINGEGMEKCMKKTWGVSLYAPNHLEFRYPDEKPPVSSSVNTLTKTATTIHYGLDSESILLTQSLNPAYMYPVGRRLWM
jgi:hypothetical protein